MARPNILWVVTTQWRGQALGLTDPNARTPVIDRLAQRGVHFAQAVTPHPFGPFARAALLTGTPSPENGIRDYFDPLPVTARTVAHDLNERGYATGFFGKWHLAPRDPQAALVGDVHAKTLIPAERRGGFSFWEGFESGFLLNDPWLHGSDLSAPTQIPGYQSDVLAARAAAWIKKIENGRPTSSPQQRSPASIAPAWFCLVSLEAPHPPYDAPVPPGIDHLDPAEIILSANVPLQGEVELKVRKELAGYYAHIAATDCAIGRLIDSLSRNTIVVVTSVHGDMHGSHGLFRKGWPYEESVRVPLVVARLDRETERAEKEKISSAMVSLTDLRRLAGSWAEDSTGGEIKGFATILADQVQRISMPSIVALPHQCDRCWRGVRSDKRKLILNADGSPWLFFDLEQDPLEQQNLVDEPRWAAEISAGRERVIGNR